MNYPFRYCVNKVLLNNHGTGFLDSQFIVGVEPRKDGLTAKASFTLDPKGEDKTHQLVARLKIEDPVEVWGTLGSRSSAIFDLDDDGDLDLVTNEFNDGPMVSTSNLSERIKIRALKIQLSGRKSNAAGLDAVVRVHAGETVLTKINDGKSGYMSQSMLPLYFGLGEKDAVNKVVVKWPSGIEQTISGPIQLPNSIKVIEDTK